MTKGKVVLVPFPFDDLTTSKVRPAVCLTNPFGQYKHVVLAFITSRVSLASAETDLILTPSDADFEETGLKVPSAIRLHRLVTVSTSVIKRELGNVTSRLRMLFEL